MPDDKKVAVLGAGMHEWGKWGRPFVEYGLAAARDALADAGLGWRDMQFVSGADTIRNGYPGFVSGATFAQALGWTGARVSSVYAACASGAVAIANARAQILAGLCDVALVVGADTTPKGFFDEGEEDPDTHKRLDRIHLGLGFFAPNVSPEFGAFIILHELSHFVSRSNGEIIGDFGRGWFDDIFMKSLPAVQRLANADSYAGFAHECRVGSAAKPAFVQAAPGGLGGAR